MHFPISGVDINPLIPVGVAFLISVLASVAGLSGAFLLLPFQVSVLRFTSPAVSPTNLVFNIIATPGGVYRYSREGRMIWPLTAVIIAGSIPGISIGAFLRIFLLTNPRTFKFFIGWVLLYMAYRLIVDLLRQRLERIRARRLESGEAAVTVHGKHGQLQRIPPGITVQDVQIGFFTISYEFHGTTYRFNTLILLLLSLVVGVVGGIYGIGGGAIIAPFIVTFFGLPIYTIAGATLLSTFATSAAGIIAYLILAGFFPQAGMAIAPDWLLGAFFGVGGFAGVYLGARIQRFIPQNIIKGVLAILITFLAVNYIVQFFR